MSTSNERDSSDINPGILVVSGLGLILILAIVFLFPLYARWVLRRQARTLLRQQIRARQSQLAQARDQVTPKGGLDAATIAALPIFAYKAKGSSPAAADCAVCLGALQEEEMVRPLPSCMHTFHADCIDLWLASHSTCPVCRIDAIV